MASHRFLPRTVYGSRREQVAVLSQRCTQQQWVAVLIFEAASASLAEAGRNYPAAVLDQVAQSITTIGDINRKSTIFEQHLFAADKRSRDSSLN